MPYDLATRRRDVGRIDKRVLLVGIAANRVGVTFSGPRAAFSTCSMKGNKMISIISPNCPVCPGQGEPLCGLGALCWFRCRACGMNFSRRRRIRQQGSGVAVQRQGSKHG